MRSSRETKTCSPEFARCPWWYVTGPAEEGCSEKIVFFYLVAVDTADQNKSELTSVKI
jgi:hypothetical protein